MDSLPINVKLEKRRQECLECVRKGNNSKLKKLLDSGLSPNFHDFVSGETPLTLACSKKGVPMSTVYMLVRQGAQLGLQNHSGFIPLQVALLANNGPALDTLFDLGFDVNELVPSSESPVLCWATSQSLGLDKVSRLLKQGADPNLPDSTGTFPLHHAAKNGQILTAELLLYFGAQINGQCHVTGNTPLHVAAQANHEQLVNMLLLRGADKTVPNHKNITAQQIAEEIGSASVAELISNHDPTQICSISASSMRSAWCLKESPFHSYDSPKQVSRAHPSFYSQEDPSASYPHPTTRSYVPRKEPVLKSSLSSVSAFGPQSTAVYPRYIGVKVYIKTKSGGSLRGLPGEMSATQTEGGRVRLFQELPGTYYKVVKSYTPTLVSHMHSDLTLEKGATVEVLFVGDLGMLEGRVKDKVGWFPASHVDSLMDSKGGGKYGSHRSGGLFGRKPHRREGIPREVKLKRPKKSSTSYGFIIKGAKASAPNFIPTPRFPALQYFDSVDKGGIAEKAGLRPGDFILEFNNEDVRGITHDDLVHRIRDAKDGFSLKVMTPLRNTPHHVINSTLPSRRLGGPLPPQRNPQTSLSLSRIKSPSLSQINFTGLSGSEDDVTNNQPMTSAGALSLQDLFKPSSQAAAANPEREEEESQSALTEQPTNHSAAGSSQTAEVIKPKTPSGTKKLFVSAKNSEKGAGRMCQSELDLRQLGTSVESLDSLEQMSHSKDNKRASIATTGSSTHEQDVNGNLLTVNSSSTVSLTVDALSSGTSTLLEEDEEAEIAAADGRQQIYANISNKIVLHNNHHKPVIKSKSKELPPTSQTVPNNSSLKSAFYNRSKTKKPAPPPPKRKQTPKQVGVQGSAEAGGIGKDDLPDLKSNLIQSDLALSETSKIESTNISNISNIKSSFKPKKDPSSDVIPDPQPEDPLQESKTEVMKLQQKQGPEVPVKLEPEVQPDEPNLQLNLAELPSPDYSDESEPELEVSEDVEVPSQQHFGPKEKLSLASDAISSHISSKSSYESIQEARELSLAELQRSIANQEEDMIFEKPKRTDFYTAFDRHSICSSTNSIQLEAQPETFVSPDSSNSFSDTLKNKLEVSNSSFRADEIEDQKVKKPVSSKPNARSGEVEFGSSSSVVVTEKPPLVAQNNFHADLNEALSKRKSRLESNIIHPSSFVEEPTRIPPQTSETTLQRECRPSSGKTPKTSSEEAVRESRKESLETSLAPKVEAEKPDPVRNLPKRSVSKVNNSELGGSEEDVDALINQFYVAPPPETLMQESASSTFLQTCSYSSSSHDQGYESASVSPDSTRSENHLPVSTFLKQRLNASNNNNNNTNFPSGDSNKNGGSQNVSGFGDRFSTNQRKGLSELLAEHINRKKQQNESWGDVERGDSEQQQQQSQQPFHAQIRSSLAKEVLTKSQYPKSERLLQLINQPVTACKPSYLNNLIGCSTPSTATAAATHTKTDSVLPTKKSFQPPPRTTIPDSTPNTSTAPGGAAPTPSSSARSGGAASPKPLPLSSPSSGCPHTPESTSSTFRSPHSVSHSYPRFSSSNKPGTLVSTPRESVVSPPPPAKMDKPIRSQQPAASEKSVGGSSSANQIAALALDMQPVDDWDVDTVCEWLRSINMSEYESKFRSNDIAGSHLKMLTKSDLAELGVSSLGHRLTLERAIKQLPVDD